MSLNLSSPQLKAGILFLFLWLPVVARAHSLPSHEGWSGQLHLATTWRSHHQLSAQEQRDGVLWQVPGLLMGGHASPYEQDVSLDEASLQLNYLHPQGYYAVVKIGHHAGHDLELENAWLGYQWQVGWTPLMFEVGQMTAFFSPTNHHHPSTHWWSLPSLSYSLFLGGHIQDRGVRALWGQEERGWSLGLEAYTGQAYPATRGQGLEAVFLSYAHQGYLLDWQVRLWSLQAKADAREDDRHTAGHQHGSSATSLDFDGYWYGDTQVNGLYAQLAWHLGHQQQLSLGVEWMQVDVDGRVTNRQGSQQMHLQGDYQGVRLEPALHLGRHTWALAYEQIAFKNNLLGQAAPYLGSQAGLINTGHNPERWTGVWFWQWRPELALRMEWMYDRVNQGREQQVLMLGVIWQSDWSS